MHYLAHNAPGMNSGSPPLYCYQVLILPSRLLLGPGEGDASTCGVEVIPRGMTAEEFGKMSLKQRKKALKWEQAKYVYGLAGYIRRLKS